ncbi:p2 family Phage major capsid protein [Escherichia coli BCE030_MS-09]|nr:p2 family Phage major capsid protein [Escherichia coli BCE030_MS-09]
MAGAHQNRRQRTRYEYVTLTSRNMDNTVAHAGKYANADALVQDARSSLLDEWHKEATTSW